MLVFSVSGDLPEYSVGLKRSRIRLIPERDGRALLLQATHDQSRQAEPAVLRQYRRELLFREIGGAFGRGILT